MESMESMYQLGESIAPKVANVSLPDFDLDFMDLGGSVHFLLGQGLEVVEDISGQIITTSRIDLTIDDGECK